MLTVAHIVIKKTWGKKIEMQTMTYMDVELGSPASYRDLWTHFPYWLLKSEMGN